MSDDKSTLKPQSPFVNKYMNKLLKCFETSKTHFIVFEHNFVSLFPIKTAEIDSKQSIFSQNKVTFCIVTKQELNFYERLFKDTGTPIN